MQRCSKTVFYNSKGSSNFREVVQEDTFAGLVQAAYGNDSILRLCRGDQFAMSVQRAWLLHLPVATGDGVPRRQRPACDDTNSVQQLGFWEGQVAIVDAVV